MDATDPIGGCAGTADRGRATQVSSIYVGAWHRDGGTGSVWVGGQRWREAGKSRLLRWPGSSTPPCLRLQDFKGWGAWGVGSVLPWRSMAEMGWRVSLECSRGEPGSQGGWAAQGWCCGVPSPADVCSPAQLVSGKANEHQEERGLLHFPPPVTRFLGRAFGPSAAGPAGGRPLVTSSTLPGTSQPLAPSPLRFCALRYYFSQPRPLAAPEEAGGWRGGGWAGTHPPARSTSHRLAGARPRDPTSRRAGFVAPALAAARREGRVSHLGLAGPCLRGSGRGRERPPCGSALTPRRRAQPERAQGCPPSPAPPLPRSMAGRLPACVVDCGTG